MKKITLLFCSILMIALVVQAQKHCNTEFAYKLGQMDAKNYQEKKQISMGMRCKKDTAYLQEDFERDYNRGYDEVMAELGKLPKDTVNHKPVSGLTEMGFTEGGNLTTSFTIDDKDGIKEFVIVFLPECLQLVETPQVTSSTLSNFGIGGGKIIADRAVIKLSSAKMTGVDGVDMIFKIIDVKGNQEDVKIKLVKK